MKARFTLAGSMAVGDKIRWVTTTEAHLAKLMAMRPGLTPHLQTLPGSPFSTFFTVFFDVFRVFWESSHMFDATDIPAAQNGPFWPLFGSFLQVQ